MLSLTLMLQAVGVAQGAKAGQAANVVAVMLPPGPAPKPIPLDQRDPPIGRTRAASSPLPTAVDLFGPSGSPRALLPKLKENPRLATSHGSVYGVGGADHLIEVTLDPLNYQDATGQWRKIDTSLIHGEPPSRRGEGPFDEDPPPEEEKEGYYNEAGPIEVFFPDLLGPDSPLSFTIPHGSLSVLPLKLADPVKATLDGEWVSYLDAAPGIDLSYTATPHGYKENVVLKEPPTGDRISWEVWAKGLALRLEPTGEVSVLAGEDLVAFFPVTIVFDSASEGEGSPATTNFDYELLDLGGGLYDLAVVYDVDWLFDPARVYPVTIDPSPEFEDFFPSDDTFASSATGGTVEGSHYNVQAGGGSGAFTYLDFSTDSYERNNRLVYLAAALLQRDPYRGTTSGTVEAKRITPDSWDEDTLTWNNKPGVGTGVFDSATGSDVDAQTGWQSWDGLGDLYQRFIDPTSPDHYASNKGFRLSIPSGSNWHVWCSKDFSAQDAWCNVAAVKPVLYLYFNDIPDAPSASNPPTGQTIKVGSPTLSATAIPSDFNGDDVFLNFQISKSASDWDPEGDNFVTESGWIDHTNWIVDAGALKDGGTYYWRVQSGDWCADWDSMCSNIDADDVTHEWKASTPRSITVNLPHHGSDPKWPMWTQGLGNGMSLQVNEATGNLFLSYPVEGLATPAGPLEIALTYNSQLMADPTSDIGLSPGWNVSAGALSDARRLPTKLTEVLEADGDGVTVQFGDGEQVHYAHLGGTNSNTFISAGADEGRVFKNPATPVSWTYTTASGSVYTFNDVGDLLTATPADKDWASGSGFTYTFEDIGGAKRLRYIDDPLSRRVTLTWSAGTPTRLTSIVTWVSNQTWTIGYDASNRPFTVTDPVNQVVEFTYDPTLGYLSGIKDGQLRASGSSDTTTITYLDEASPLPDRVSEIKAPPAAPGGATVYPTKFEYAGVLNGDIVTQTTVTDPRGTKTNDPGNPDDDTDYATWIDFNTAGLPIRVFGPYDQNSFRPLTRMVWDGNGNLICSRTPEANAAGGEKCINPAEPVYDNLDDVLNTDYDYQAEAPFALLKVTAPDPDQGGPNLGEVTEYKYDEQPAGVAMTGLVDQQFANATLSGVPDWKIISGAMDWNWNDGYPATLPAGTTDFSLRFNGVLTVTSKKTYAFRVKVGGAHRLVIGGRTHVCWVTRVWPNCGDTMDFALQIKANKPIPITLEYRSVYADTFASRLKFEWDQGTGNWQTVPMSIMAPRLGLVTSAIDSAGTTTWSFPDDQAKLRNLPASRTRAGRTTSWVYNDAYGRVTTETVDLSGHPITTQYAYTDACLTQTTDPTGGITTYTCNAAGDVTKVKRSVPAVPGTNQSTDQMRVVDTTHDDLGRVTKVTVAHPDDAGSYPDTDYVYDSANRVKQTTDPLGFVTDLAYDQAGRLISKSLPSPGGGAPRPVYTYHYDEAGNQNKMTDPRQHDWLSVHDALNRVTQATVPAGTDDTPSTTYNIATNYNVTNRTVTVTTPGGLDSQGAGVTTSHVTTRDLLGRVTSEQTGMLPAETFTYDDALHKITSLVNGVSSYTLHNAFGEVIEETCQACNAGADATTHYTYDTAGRLKTRVDARAANSSDLNHTWTYNYDDAGRLVSSQLPAPLSNVVSIVYDAAGEQVKVTTDGDIYDYVRKYAYDVRGRLISLDNGRGTTTYQYDDNDRLTHAFLPSSLPPTQATTLRYTYDNLGRRTNRWGVLAGGQMVNAETFGYDPNGNLTSASSDAGPPPPAVTIQYDFSNRIWKVTQGNKVTEYTYVGTQLSSEVDFGGTNDYRYRANDGLLLTQTPAFGGSTIQYGYDSYGRVLTRTDPQTPTPVTYTVAYDQGGRVKSKQASVGATNLMCFERQFDAVGNVKKEAQTQGSACPAATPTWSDYQYDNANRLSQEAIEGGTTTNFGYDGAGNRTSVQVVGGATVTTAYDVAGFPESASDGTDYTTDALGELSTVTKAGSTTSYSYDAWGRTTQVVNPAGTFTYANDALDRTASKSGPGGNSTFAYVGTSQDPVSMTVSGSTFAYDYTRAGPLAQKNGATVRFHLTDLHGDAVGLLNPSGQSVGTTTFDAWGQKTASSGTQGYLGYQGDPTDSDTALVDMGARHYLPALGRFTTEDILVGDPRDPMTLNRFVYGGDNPVTFIDPDGLCIRLEADMPCFNASDGSGRKRPTEPSCASSCNPTGGWVSPIERLLRINGPEPFLDRERLEELIRISFTSPLCCGIHAGGGYAGGGYAPGGLSGLWGNSGSMGGPSMAGFTALSPPGTGSIIDVHPGGPGAYIDFTTTIWERGPEILINTGGPDLGLNVVYDKEEGEEGGGSGEETPKDILMPGGEPIGEEGEGPDVRVIPGGDEDAEELFGRLTKGGTENTPSGYPGTGVDLPGGGWVGHRPVSGSGGPAIDIKIPDIPFTKVHIV